MPDPVLLLPYEEDARIQALLRALQATQPAAFQIEGLYGSLPSLLVATLYSATQGQAGKQILVLPDEDALNYCQEELQALLPDATFHTLLPATEKGGEPLAALERSQGLDALLNPQPAWILSLPAALYASIQKEGRVKRLRRLLKRGDSLDMSTFCEEMEGSGFSSSEEVHEPGQYALRGSRLDIFSYAHKKPLRITLWGASIVRISFFETETQLSFEEIEEASLLAHPDVSLPYSQSVPLLSELPTGSTLWWMFSSTASLSTDPVEKEAVAQYLSPHIHLYFGKGAPRTSRKRLSWESSPQPPLEDFAAMVAHLRDWQQRGYKLWLAGASTLQSTRLREVLLNQDPALKIEVLPVPIHKGFLLPEMRWLCYTDHELTGRSHLPRPVAAPRNSFSLRKLQELQAGDYVVHIDQGMGRFAGLETITQNGKKQEMLRLLYKDNDLFYLSIHALHKLSKYSGKEGIKPPLSKLGGTAWATKKQRTKGNIKKMAQELISLYAARKAAPGHAFSRDPFAEAALVSSFLYEDTPDQASATAAVMADMEAPHPMDRLICGDVGFGKTEIAVRAAFKAVRAGKQVALLVPTTVLALQHYRSFCERLAPFELHIAHLHRFRGPKERKEIQSLAKTGEINILIGTSSLISESLQFKDLGLLIIDEEQKFGVRIKEQLKTRRTHIDTLTLSATPIPRTLHFSLTGLRDISIIATPPPKRQPIYTTLHRFDKNLAQEAIHMELARKGQVFFVHNRIEQLPQQAQLLEQLAPGARIGLAHGKMRGEALEKSMYQFVAGAYDILLCTNIIENGLDIPNANTILIQDAHQFGLAELHQMRGRVGRSDRKAFCHLLTPERAALSPQALKRLAALEAFSSLGDGYKLALKDLDIRGAGNLLGAEQSGFISELGFDTYHKVLDEALQELKASKTWTPTTLPPESHMRPPVCSLETHLEAYLPSTYVRAPSTRMQIYKALGEIQEIKALEEHKAELIDRFGELPEAAKGLLNSVVLRIYAQACGFEKIILKRNRLQCFFNPEDESFKQKEQLLAILTFAQQRPQCQLHEEKEKGSLRIFSVHSFEEAIHILKKLSTTEKIRTP